MICMRTETSSKIWWRFYSNLIVSRRSADKTDWQSTGCSLPFKLDSVSDCASTMPLSLPPCRAKPTVDAQHSGKDTWRSGRAGAAAAVLISLAPVFVALVLVDGLLGRVFAFHRLTRRSARILLRGQRCLLESKLSALDCQRT